MSYFAAYATIAYGFIFMVTLVRFIHFFIKFRVVTLNEFGRACILFWAAPLLLSLLTFPFEVYWTVSRRTIVDLHYAYEIACIAFNMKYEQLHFAYRVRYHNRYEIDDRDL